ncbi:hypothetical protein NIES2100_17550 [Calothrix sp. NIES-2100]|uniref:hypothetical protein n=1 Tax=Calothrix sp. NIES-2100 TaxID=1954172 RepID=UPI000B5E8905|nr:hypothetical protein NIES2100_17550 [Calothrix sp. NIES-2100]
MFLDTRCSNQYRKRDRFNKVVSISITRQHQGIGVNWRKKIDFLQSWVKRPNLSAKWHINKSLSTDVKTETTNGYMNYFMKNLNNYRNFSQKFNCDLSYIKGLSKLQLKYFNFGSFSKIKQDIVQQLTVVQQSNYQRYKINFGITEEVLQPFPSSIMEILLTGNRFSRNECYKVAT